MTARRRTAPRQIRWAVAGQQTRRKLMIAYRLHFERANLEAVSQLAKQRLGDVRHISGTLTVPVRDPGNVRLGSPARGGGPLYDLGIYCLNAARYLFRA